MEPLFREICKRCQEIPKNKAYFCNTIAIAAHAHINQGSSLATWQLELQKFFLTHFPQYPQCIQFKKCLLLHTANPSLEQHRVVVEKNPIVQLNNISSDIHEKGKIVNSDPVLEEVQSNLATVNLTQPLEESASTSPHYLATTTKPKTKHRKVTKSEHIKSPERQHYVKWSYNGEVFPDSATIKINNMTNVYGIIRLDRKSLMKAGVVEGEIKDFKKRFYSALENGPVGDKGENGIVIESSNNIFKLKVAKCDYRIVASTIICDECGDKLYIFDTILSHKELDKKRIGFKTTEVSNYK